MSDEIIQTNVGGATVTIKSVEHTPSEELKASARREATIADPTGRMIKLLKPSVIAQFDLIEALGDTARNEVYMSMVLPLLFVASIDGTAVPRPSTKAELKALIQRLDEDGIQAVLEGVAKNFAAPDEAEAKNG